MTQSHLPKNLFLFLAVVFQSVSFLRGDDYQEGWTKLVVGTGYTQSTGFYRGTSDFEVIDLSPILSPGGVRPPTQLSCDPLPDLPESGLANAAGAFWDDLPHVCGGVNGFDQLDGCYRYERGLGRWIQVENLTLLDEPRFAAASWNSPGSNWFIHDGVSGPVLSEREITLDQGQDIFREYRIESGLNNEHGVAMHAMVRLFIDMEAVMDDDIIRYYIAGGQNAEGTQFYNETWLLEYLVKGQYSRQSDMQEGRSSAFFGMARSLKPTEGGVGGDSNATTTTTTTEAEEVIEDAVVVAGGFNSDGYLDSTEIYSPLEDVWRYGGALPARIRGGMSVQLNSTFLALGGVTSAGTFSDRIYAWDETAEEWNAESISIGTGRAYAVAFLVPDDAVNCS